MERGDLTDVIVYLRKLEGLQAERDRLREVNAELLFACRAFVEQYDKLAGFPHACEPYVGACIVARAAIAKATADDTYKEKGR
jgi:hypothetical protein